MSTLNEVYVAVLRAEKQQQRAENHFFSAPTARIAHVGIDVQADFCKYSGFWDAIIHGSPATPATDNIAKRIGAITPTLRNLCEETFIVFMDTEGEGIDRAKGGLYQIRPRHDDVIIPKTVDNALEEPQMKKELDQRHISHILVSGFRADCCVKKFVLSALRDFNVAVMADAVGLGYNFKAAPHLNEMQEAGALLVTSDKAITHLRQNQHQLALPRFSL